MVKYHNWGATIINCILPSGMKQFWAQKVSKTSAIKKNFYFFRFKTMINGDEMLLIYPPPPPINIYPQHEKLFRWTGFAFIDFYSIPNCCSFFSLSNRNLHKNNESSIRKLIFLHVALFSMRTHNIQAISLVFFLLLL